MKPNYPLTLQFIFSILCLVIILIVSSIVWLGYLDLRDLMNIRSPAKLTANSSLVLLVRFDTNAPASFVVSEIWKQTAEESAQPVKVGERFPSGRPKDAGPLPDGEVIFSHKDPPIPFIEPNPKLTPWSEYVIWQGRIDDMTVQQFKAASGL